MALQTAGFVGPVPLQDGAVAPPRQEKTGGLVVQELHGRFYEQNYRNRVFSDGISTVVAITAATYNIGTLTATVTPIAGLWNPPNSPVNAVLLSATLNTVKTALQNTGCAPFFWATSNGQLAITAAGNVPLSRKSLVKQGAFCKGFCNVAPTGLVGSLVVQGASSLGGGGSCIAAFLETQAGDSGFHAASRELFDGEFIIPPGGFIALLAGSAPVAVSATSMLVWEEVDL